MKKLIIADRTAYCLPRPMPRPKLLTGVTRGKDYGVIYCSSQNRKSDT